MTRMKVLGLCLVAAFALSAFAAAGAQAGQVGTCVKAAKVNKKYTGKYTNKTCTTAATEAEITEGKKNKYEWAPLSSPVKFTSEGGESKLKGSAGEIVCKHGTDAGEFINGTENKDTFTFDECTLLPFGLACKSAGEAEGVIKSNLLTSKLIDHGEKGLSGKEPAVGEVWNEMSAAVLAEFECDGIPFTVTGSVSGVIPSESLGKALKAGKAGKKGPGTGKPSYKEDYTEAGGEQDLTTTFFNPETSKVESGPSVQLGTNEIDLVSPPKGFEIDAI